MSEKKSGPISAREKVMLENQKRHKIAVRRKKRKIALRRAMGVMVISLVAFLLFAICMSVVLIKHFSSSPNEYDYSLYVKIGEENVKETDSFLVKDNLCYVSLNWLSELTSSTLMGDASVMTVLFEPDIKVSFYVNTSTVQINGVNRIMPGVSYFNGYDADVYFPINFFEGAIDGIRLVTERNKNKLAYTLEISENMVSLFDPTQPVPSIESDKAAIYAKPQFKADLSAYEMYMQPENPDEYIMLISTSYPLDENYKPDDLIDVEDTRKDRSKRQMREYAAKALEAMFIEMRANGFNDVSVTSAYRSYQEQQTLFNNSFANFSRSYDKETAYAKTAAQIAIPGTSEHQSGLCADLHNLPAASQAFESEDVYKWLYANCAEFGFILRFPKDKTDITGIIFEPWHYRYVGRSHARKIMQDGLCLEEYCEQNNIGF